MSDQFYSELLSLKEAGALVPGALVPGASYETKLDELINKYKPKEIKNDEPLTNPSEDRFVMHPIKYQKTFDWFEKQCSHIWLWHEVTDKFAEDRDHWSNKLNDDERHFIELTLAFFAISDGIVGENLVTNFCNEVQLTEARANYDIQNFIERVHNITYSLMIVNLIDDPEKKDKLLHAVEHYPIVNKMMDWTKKWMDPSRSFAERLIGFAVVEGVFFSGPFASIFWLRSRQLMPALSKANEFISRDEGFHRDFACHLYKDILVNKISEENAHQIIKEGTDVACVFVTESLPVRLIGMNEDHMTQYIKYIADHLSVSLGLSKIYNVSNPFSFIDINSYGIKSSFFEDKSTVYSNAGSFDKSKGLEELEDF